jgi:hypothetical protein
VVCQRHDPSVDDELRDGRSVGLWDAARQVIIPVDFEAALFSKPILRAVHELTQPAPSHALWRCARFVADVVHNAWD